MVSIGTLNLVPQASISTKTGSVVKQVGKGGFGGLGGLTIVLEMIVFNDPEWDGEPLDPEPTTPRTPPQPCNECGKRPCECVTISGDPCPMCGYTNCRCNNGKKRMIRVSLSNSRVCELKHTATTTFWAPNGTQMTAEEFLKSLFGQLPTLFSSEEELRKIWSKPDTRKKLLNQLEERGFAKPQLKEFQKVLEAEDADLYDVLSFIAYESKIIPRGIRAEYVRETIAGLTNKQQEFINFVLSQYVKEGVDELDIDKLKELLTLKYQEIADAKRELGSIEEIRNSFIGFQHHLYSVYI